MKGRKKDYTICRRYYIYTESPMRTDDLIK